MKNESKEKQENIEKEGKRELLKYFSKIYGMQVEKGVSYYEQKQKESSCSDACSKRN